MFIIVDLGSTKTKVIVLDAYFNVIQKVWFETPFQTKDKLMCIDPEGIVKKVFEEVKRLEISKVTSEKLYISVTGMGSTILVTSKNGEVLYPAISWNCKTELPVKIKINTSRTGKVPLLTYPLYKIPWLQQKVKDFNVKNVKYVSLPDYVLSSFLSFKHFWTDFSFASRSMLFDDISCRWDEEISRALNLSVNNLPSTTEAGTIAGNVSSEVKDTLKLPENTFVSVGMHDHIATAYFGNLLSKKLSHHLFINPAGTTESIIVVCEKHQSVIFEAPEYFLNSESTWNRGILAIVGYSCLSGKIMEAVKQFDFNWNILSTDFIENLLVSPSRKRLLVDDRGYLIADKKLNISLDIFWAQLILSTQFEVRRVIEDIKKILSLSRYDSILVLGGQSSNTYLCSIKSCVTGLPVFSLPGVEAAALGTAMRTGIKNNLLNKEKLNAILSNLCKNIRKFYPEEKLKSTVEELYKKYTKLISSKKEN